MASKGLLFALFLVTLLVTNCYSTCHARLLRGFAPNSNALVGTTASPPGLNLALPTRFFKTSPVQPPSLSGGGNGGGGNPNDEDSNKVKSKYMELRTLVLASLPKGRTVPSGPSLRHNDVNT